MGIKKVLLNEMHAHQTSKKVKAALHTKFANGLHIGAYAFIGYMRDIVRVGQPYTDLLLRHYVSYCAMRSSNPRVTPGYLVVGQDYCAPPAGTRQTCKDFLILVADLRTTKGRLLALNPTLLSSDLSSGTVICIP